MQGMERKRYYTEMGNWLDGTLQRVKSSSLAIASLPADAATAYPADNIQWLGSQSMLARYL